MTQGMWFSLKKQCTRPLQLQSAQNVRRLIQISPTKYLFKHSPYKRPRKVGKLMTNNIDIKGHKEITFLSYNNTKPKIPSQ